MEKIDLLSFSIYIFSGAVCLVLAIVLYVLTHFGNGSVSFKRIKQNLAYCALLDLLIYIVAVYYQVNGLDFLSLDHCYVPMLYYFQLLLLSYALHRLIYSPHLRTLKRKFFSWTGSVAFISYVSIYIYGCKGQPTAEYINMFHQPGGFQLAVKIVVNFLALWFFLLNVYWVTRASIRYYRRVNNYFSGRELNEAKYALYFVYAFFVYFFSALASLLATTMFFHNLMTLVNTTFYVTLCVYVIAYENYYVRNAKAIKVLDPKEDTKPESELVGVASKIEEWKNRPEKPYLKEGLTLIETANQMGINSRILSAYINQLCDTSFNMWVNELRVEEVKRLMADPNMTLTEISQRTGFGDLAAMSKVFKRIAGETPSVYRRKV